jgi:hypothetical protein
MTLAVNRAAVEADVMRRREIRTTSFGRWIATRFAASLVAFCAVALLVRASTDAPALRDMSGWTLTVFLGVPVFVAIVVTFVAEQLAFSDAALDPDRAAARLSREVDRLTGPRWPLRALAAAVQLALCLGVVIAVVAYWTGRPALLARGSDQAIVLFGAATLLVSIILIFVIRAAALASYRRFLVDTSEPESMRPTVI